MSARPRALDGPPLPPGWEPVRVIADGGSSRVYEVVGADGRRAALKLARWHDVDLHVRFVEEARLLGQIGPPAVPALLEQGTHRGWPYLVLEHLGESSLAGFLAEQDDPVRLDLATSILADLVAAVAEVHKAGVVHCDLKPENVFLTAGRVRLVDLGVARRLRGGKTTTDVDGGTAYYLAPEQLRGGAIDDRCDVYAIGAIAFEILTGRPPFVGERPAIEYGHLLCRPPRVHQLRPVPAELDALVADCLAKAPEARPSLREITQRLSGTGPLLAAPPPAAEATSESGLVALLWIGGGAALDVVRAVERTRGVAVGRRASGLLAAYTCGDHDRPLAAAIATAGAVAAGTPVCIHVATATIRRAASGRIVIGGAPVASNLDWLPTEPWTGLVFTAAAARELPEGAVLDATEAPGFHRTADPATRAGGDGAEPPMVARAGIVADLIERARAACAGRPALITVIGEPGMGRTRLCTEIRHGLAGDARVIALDGRRASGGDRAFAAALTRELGGLDLASVVRGAGPGLVIVIDDAQWIDDTVLDELETATGWQGARLAVVVAASSELTRARPRWGERAREHVVIDLEPLGAEDAETLLRALLLPALKIPVALIEQLAARGAGLPGVLVGIVEELRRQGAIRRHAGSDEWYLDADRVDRVPMRGGARWVVARRLAGLPPGVRALVERCAVLGLAFDLQELEAIQPAPAADGTPEIDPAAGLDWLCRAGLMIVADGGHAFASAALQEVAYAQLDPARRDALHRAAYAHWQERATADAAHRLRRIAYHAAPAGDVATAVAALLALARAAQRSHAALQAERLLTTALDLLGDAGGRPVAEALAARGRARRMLTHYEEARADLARARAIAEEIGDTALAIDLLIADGAVCDFTERLSESAAQIEEAARRAGPDLPVPVRARLCNWLGVVRARQGRLDEAVRELNLAIGLAEVLGDAETATGSRLMLGGALRRLGRLEDGLAVLDDVIARCEAAGDPFHLTVGLINRINAWRRLHRIDEAERDCQRAIATAERHGLGQLEMWGWHNLAELRWTAGDLAGARAAAERACELGARRFRDRPPPVATIQLAVLATGAGDVARARELQAGVAAADTRTSPGLAVLDDAIGASLASDRAPWNELVERAHRDGADGDALMVIWLRATSAARAGRPAEVAAALADARIEADRQQIPWPGPFAGL